MENINRRPVTFEKVIRSPSFVLGHTDAINNQPFRYDFPQGNVAGQHQYEQGRILGQIFRGQLRKGGRVNTAAIDAIKNNMDLF